MDSKKLHKEKIRRRKNIGLGFIVIGTTGIAISLLKRGHKVNNLALEVAKRMETSCKSEAVYIVHGLVKRIEPPLFVGTGAPGFFIPIGGGEEYDARKGRLVAIWTGSEFDTKYESLLLETEVFCRVFSRGDCPLTNFTKEMDETFRDCSRFEVLKNTKPVYFCPKKMVLSDNLFAISRKIASLDTEYDKHTLAAFTSSLAVGFLCLTSTF
ncbi:hypothetical protein C8_368 [Cannes 8 virus]|nr:hypothetical protein C8_368 [Cannes 8 virus]